MTRALVAVNNATLGGVYYSDDIDFTDLATQPTWTRLSTTGLANLLIKRVQYDSFSPYSNIYLQLDNDTCYHYNGTSWDQIMTLATARTLVSLGSGLMGYLFIDKSASGTVYIPMSQDSYAVVWLKSTDYGATWSTITVATGLVTAVCYGQAYGLYLIACFGQLYRSVWFSVNGGTSWTKNGIWATSYGGGQIKQNVHDPAHAYYHVSATDFDLLDVTIGSSTELQNGYALCADHQENHHWIDRLTAGHERIVKTVSGDAQIYSTTDGWATLVNNTPSVVASAVNLTGSSLAAALDNVTYGIFGRDSNPGGGVHIVFGFVGDNPASATGIAGTNYNTPPYTDAIPGAAGCYVADCGIWVGESTANSGIEIYSIEHDAYDTDHKPMRGSQSSWRDMDADQNDAGDPASYSHAEDIQELTPQRHNPWPASSGQAPVSDGSKYVATDIATQAELNAHTGDTGIHGGAAEYADDDVPNPPTQEDITAAFGAPYTHGQGKLGLLDDAGLGLREYLCISDGTYWHYLPLVKARSEYESDALTRYGAVITANAGEGNYAVEPNVIIEGGLWKMWYRIGYGGTGVSYATSPDGLNWTRYGSNPVVANYFCPFVFKDGSTYHLYVVTTDWQQFDHYTSTNGTSWTSSAAAVLTVGGGGAWDASGLGNMCVWKEGANDWRMLYEARGAPNVYKIGYATSADGNTWSKSGGNPVITEVGSVSGPFVYKYGSNYYLWTHRSVSSTLPSDIARYSSSDLTTWAFDGIKITRTGADEGAGLAVGQAADPCIVVHNGVMYLYYEGSPDGSAPSQTNIKLITGKESLIWA